MASTMEALLLAQNNFLQNPPLLTVEDTANATTSYAANAFTTAKLGTVDDDTYSGWSTSSNTWTCPVAGRYQAAGSVAINSVSSSTYGTVCIYRNGVIVTRSRAITPTIPSGTGAFTQIPITTCHITLAIGDTISLLGQFGLAVTSAPGSSLELRYIHS